MTNDKKFLLGQYFTEPKAVKRAVDLTLRFKNYGTGIRILEPSAGTGNFVNELVSRGFNVTQYEIDGTLCKTPVDFFDVPLKEKFDLIIGNPPFTNYNVKNSYYFPSRYSNAHVSPEEYLPYGVQEEKMRVEEAFILKAIKHLKGDSAIGFVLPVSFFVSGKNQKLKQELTKAFSTIIVYQTDDRWVADNLPCCFVLLTSIKAYDNEVVLVLDETGTAIKQEAIPLDSILTEDVVPKAFFYKKGASMSGTPLSEYIDDISPKYSKSFTSNTVNGSTILNRTKAVGDPERYSLAVVRVGNTSVGRAGLVDLKRDVLNDMFYVFSFKPKYNNDLTVKEGVCRVLNANISYFQHISQRIGSKSLKKKDILDFKVNL
jgi:hypothetical protein